MPKSKRSVLRPVSRSVRSRGPEASYRLVLQRDQSLRQQLNHKQAALFDALTDLQEVNRVMSDPIELARRIMDPDVQPSLIELVGTQQELHEIIERLNNEIRVLNNRLDRSYSENKPTNL